MPAATSADLITRVTAHEGRIWEWLLTHRPDLADSIKASDDDLATLEAALRAGIEAWGVVHSSTVSALVSDASADLPRGRASSKIPRLSADGTVCAICFLHANGSITCEHTIGGVTPSKHLWGEETSKIDTDRTDRNPVWSPPAQELICWFERAHADARLPTEPFQLEPCTRIADPAKWYARMQIDIGAGPRGPRAGVLIDELRPLREIVETNDSPA